MRQHSRGFTMVELVVALTLIALIMAGLVGALRTMAGAATRLEKVSDRVEEMLVVSDFLRRAFSAVVDLPYRDMREPETSKPFFHGEPDRLQWVGDFPVSVGVQGVHFFQLSLEGAGEKKDLVLRYLPYQARKPLSDNAPWQQQVLLREVDSLRLDYRVESGDPWVEAWPQPDARRIVPARMRATIQVGGRYWPEIIAGGVAN